MSGRGSESPVDELNLRPCKIPQIHGEMNKVGIGEINRDEQGSILER